MAKVTLNHQIEEAAWMMNHLKWPTGMSSSHRAFHEERQRAILRTLRWVALHKDDIKELVDRVGAPD